MKYFNETYTKRIFITRNEWADTYKAINAKTKDIVTLKILSNKTDDKEYIQELSKEVKILKEIQSSNLVNVDDMFVYSGLGKVYHYIEGEYYKGISLEEKLQSEDIDEQEAIKIIQSISNDLKIFHNKNIEFNDLNLRSVIVGDDKKIKLNVMHHLEHKVVKVSPEDNTVIHKKFDTQKNLKQLGEVLYCLLTSNTKFDNKNYKKQIKNKTLLTIIEKLVDKNLEDKYKNIDRLILDLKTYIQTGDLHKSSYDEKIVDEIPKKKKKSKLPKVILTLIFLAIILYLYNIYK